MLKKLEYDFLGLVNKGAINKHQLRKLPKLWVNAKWTPSDALRKKINLSFVSHVKNNLV